MAVPAPYPGREPAMLALSCNKSQAWRRAINTLIDWLRVIYIPAVDFPP
jgi:hypothetical protein